MKTQEAIDYFGTAQKLCEAVGVKSQNCTRWKRDGIPYGIQLKIQELTGNKLKFSIKETHDLKYKKKGNDAMMEEYEKLLRVYILDTLLAHSGKPLNPELIGEITLELTQRIMDLKRHSLSTK